MDRKLFSQVLKDASIDISREYLRLYQLFYKKNLSAPGYRFFSLRDACANSFSKMSFRGTCISLDDFDSFYSYHFKEKPDDFDLNYLLTFCEYSYNLVLQCDDFNLIIHIANFEQFRIDFIQQIRLVVNSIGYMEFNNNGITDFVPKDQAAISVSEIVDKNLSYRIIEYNHHTMKGDLEKKRSVLLVLADKLEPQRKKLSGINKTLESDIFFMFNKMNIRHNNVDSGKSAMVSSMDNEELERWYDDTYQMCLLAFLELDNLERKQRVSDLKRLL